MLGSIIFAIDLVMFRIFLALIPRAAVLDGRYVESYSHGPNVHIPQSDFRVRVLVVLCRTVGIFLSRIRQFLCYLGRCSSGSFWR